MIYNFYDEFSTNDLNDGQLSRDESFHSQLKRFQIYQTNSVRKIKKRDFSPNFSYIHYFHILPSQFAILINFIDKI